jgi:hypothetical protein
MKVGTEDKKKLYIMLALAVVAVLMVLRSLLSFNAPASTVAASIPNAIPAQPDAANQLARARGRTAPPLDPTLRTDLLKNSEEAYYKGTGRNIFEEQVTQPPIERPKQPVVTPPPAQPVVVTPPPPPPIPLKFFGFANKPGERKSIFLASGDDIFIGHEGDIVNRRYRILRIQQTQVEIEDVLNSNRQTIPLTQG